MKRQPLSPPSPAPAVDPEIIPIGLRFSQGSPGAVEGVAVKDLRRHGLIVAGAGSGKAIVLRRLVEEAALAGLPAIALDITNDLSRLGDPWPERPASFTDEDVAKAAAYRKRAGVVVWTPGVASGGAADDLGGFKGSEFYFATEALSRPVKLRPALPELHPLSPTTPGVVAAIARETRRID